MTGTLLLQFATWNYGSVQDFFLLIEDMLINFTFRLMMASYQKHC